MANSLQTILLRSYPGLSKLGLAADNLDEVDAVVADSGTGDRVFDFLWRELADISGDDPEILLGVLDRIVREVDLVKVLIALGAGIAPRPDGQSPIVLSDRQM